MHTQYRKDNCICLDAVHAFCRDREAREPARPQEVATKPRTRRAARGRDSYFPRGVSARSRSLFSLFLRALLCATFKSASRHGYSSSFFTSLSHRVARLRPPRILILFFSLLFSLLFPVISFLFSLSLSLFLPLFSSR